LHAGLSKLRPQNRNYYRGVAEAYEVVPRYLLSAFPLIVGSAETLIAIATVTAQTATLGLIAAMVLLSLYGLVFTKQLLEGKADVDCGCAGPDVDVKISPMLVLRNIVLVGLCIFAITVGSDSFSLSSLAANWFLTLPIASMLSLIYLSFEQLVLNQQKIEMLRNT